MVRQAKIVTGRLAQALRTADWLRRPRLLGYAAILGAFELALLLVWVFSAHDNLDLTGKPMGTDFISFWSTSSLALSGTPALAYLPEAHAAVQAAQVGGAAIGYFGFFYPPVFLLVCLPLALLPYGVALTTWLIATGVPYLFAIHRLLPRLGAVEFAACLTFPAILLNAGHGQNGFLSAALFGLGFVLLDRRPWLAGALLGCLVFKPQLAVILPFALAFSGRWPSFWAAAVSAALLTAASWALFGSETWAAFISGLLLAQQTLSDGFVDPGKMVSIFAAARLLHAPPLVALGLQVAAAAVMIVMLARVSRATTGPMLGALSVLATLLATPFALDYDLTLLAIPLAVAFRSGYGKQFLPYEKLVLLLGFALPLAARPLAVGLGIPVAPLVVLALLCLLVARLASARSAGSLVSQQMAQ
ncbi:MAG TPA: glycosyltransferase family 87 protein [Devosia sp.]|jgi:hypothetical protein|uniref:glycosyltransferase family 87 protein n=1 Tax=Devosia sp. TaxID=1871048 RepID=UPI002DDD068A|nr:glycosyltransferase family 87 protein [Devosia sp.]HEV2514372.1 glycosyltransferase family 87 protein [Devosia sp.]